MALILSQEAIFVRKFSGFKLCCFEGLTVKGAVTAF
jgi:hypothetical protein